MKHSLLTFAALVVTLTTGAAEQLPMKLWYDRPADFFEESLPLGNGKLGALVYGGTDRNTIYLNDITLWTGRPVDRDLDRDAHKWIPKIREALFREDYKAADSLQLHVQGPNSQFYQPLGTLFIDDLNQGQVTGYHRQLSLDSALAADSYVRNGSTIAREYFASAPDKLIAIRLRGDVSVRLTLTAQVPHQVKAACHPVAGGGYSQLTMTGHAIGDPQESIHYCTMLKANTTGGTLSAADSTLTIRNATEVVIYIVNETSFNGFDKHPVREGAPYLENATDDLWHTANLTYDEMRQRHVADYCRFFNRVKLRLGPTTPATASTSLAQPTDLLLKHYADGQTTAEAARYLESLYFQYGRYLLISSSRTPGVPANLQGLWTPHKYSPWRGNYTVNINLEENYWPAFVSNLAEMAEPLDGFIKALAENGRHTARNYYGISHGWCSSHNSDIWAMTNPVGEKREKPEWANWNLGGAWLVNTLWERYLFTQDKDYLRQTALPLMKGAADFCMDWLVENPKQPGELITAPSTSPENEYVTDGGYHGMTCYGGTADLAIIRELFHNTIAACNALRPATADADTGDDRTAAYGTALSRLHPYTIGHEGDLNEWYHDWRDYDPHHRHQSHLIGLYPGSHLINEELRMKNEEFPTGVHVGEGLAAANSSFLILHSSFPPLLKAAEQTLIQKGDKTTGWSTGWRINLWARLRNAQQAYHIYQKLLTYVSPDQYKGADRRRSGGTYPNLMDAHPPFQIDGNFGGTAGICEMLLQSHWPAADGLWIVELLPALPQQWSSGEATGLCARGGFEVSMAWNDGQIVRAFVKSKTATRLRVIYNGKVKTLKLKPGQTKILK